MSALKIVLLYGSTRSGRLVDRVGTYVKGIVQSKGLEPIVLDPLELPLEILKTPLHFYPNPESAPAWMHEVNDKLKSADGFIMIAPEYNSQLPGPLTNMIDHFPPASYRHRPIGLINYSMGTMGGVRAQIHAMSYAAELGMLCIPSRVVIPTAQNAFAEDGTCNEERTVKSVERLVTELTWYAKALKSQRNLEAPPS